MTDRLYCSARLSSPEIKDGCKARRQQCYRSCSASNEREAPQSQLSTFNSFVHEKEGSCQVPGVTHRRLRFPPPGVLRTRFGIFARRTRVSLTRIAVYERTNECDRYPSRGTRHCNFIIYSRFAQPIPLIAIYDLDTPRGKHGLIPSSAMRNARSTRLCTIARVKFYGTNARAARGRS